MSDHKVLLVPLSLVPPTDLDKPPPSGGWVPPKSDVQKEADRLGIHWTQVRTFRRAGNKVAKLAVARAARR